MAARIPSPPTHRRPTPDHPPYAEMVLCALRTLAEPYGSTETSISAFIQANYTSLPWGHSKLLPYYLNKILIAGEIQRCDFDPNNYVLPGHIPTLKEEKPVKKIDGLQGEVGVKRSCGRTRKNKSICSEKMAVSENAVKERKGVILKFKRKCPEGDANASDGGWMFSNKEKQEQEEGLYGAKSNVRNNMLLALPAFKSSDMKMEENGCNEKVVELQEKDMKGVEANLQNVNLLDLQEKASGDKKIDVNGEEMTLQEKDCSALKIDENAERISVFQDKNHSVSVIAENVNEKEKDTMGVEFSMQNENLALQEKDCSVAKIGENDERISLLQDSVVENGNEMLALQEKDTKGVDFIMQNENLGLQEKDYSATKIDERISVLQAKKCSSSVIEENGSEMLALQENDMKEADFNMQNDNLIALQDKYFGDMKVDVNGEKTLALQEKYCSYVNISENDESILVLQDKKCSSNAITKNSNEMLAWQEKDMKTAEFNVQNENLLAFQEKGSGDTKIDVNAEALQEIDCSGTKTNENDGRISVLQDKNCSSSIIADNSNKMSPLQENLSGGSFNRWNEKSLLEQDLSVCKNEHKGGLLGSQENAAELLQTVPIVELDMSSKKSRMTSEIDTRSKKSKAKKLRKLWFES